MKKVVIIGAGPAGITAAFQLLKNTKDEYEIIILEESNEIGGILRNFIIQSMVRDSFGR